MISLKILQIIRRSYPDAKDASISEVFIPKLGWIKAEQGAQSPIRDTLMHLQMIGGEMVNLQVVENGIVRMPDYSIKALLRDF